MSAAETDIRDSCRVCGTQTLSFLYQVNGCRIARCPRCTFVQTINHDIVDYNAALYPLEYFVSAKYEDLDTQALENDRRIALLESVSLPPGARILDAGCATGDFIAAASGAYQLWGVDLSEEAITIAKERNPAIADRLHAGPLETVDFEETRFDAITLWDVVEHVERPLTVCRGLLRLLKPGGYLVLSTPNIGAVTARLLGSRWPFMTPPEHLGFFNPASMRHLLEKELGLNIVYRRSRGKSVNLGFLIYKLKRTFPGLVPAWLERAVKGRAIGNRRIYVPTGDILHVVAQTKQAE